MLIQVQFSIFLVNKPGVLAGVAEALAKARVNIIALTLMDSMEHGVLRIVTDVPEATRDILGKAHDRWTETEVLVMELENEPGAFSNVAQRLADAHINISYAYCSGGAHGGRTTAIFKVADLKKAMSILKPPKPAGRKTPRAMKTAPPRRKKT